ncbi:MAG: amidohydrolase [Saprospiraceae bacterium]|nr:amidohydrolase [Bacteroidia bacterium]NNE16659.1 amidohydrolase [Saprospiraceae bacterium]NNL92362.1 amidohydrolase [Saprospiraceae bacterium]
MFKNLIFLLICFPFIASSQSDIYKEIDEHAKGIEKTIIDIRRSFHQKPELSNREFKTAETIASIMTKMGFKVDTGIAKTGVVAVLDTGKPGPTVALRADIDGLPVKERTKVPFASVVEAEFLGEKVGVMHACGHDTHIAMMIGAAHVLNKMKSQLSGKVVFVFQPAEEGAPPGEEGGAALMVKEGLIDKYGIDVMFGQHISAGLDVGKIRYRVGGIMAAVNRMVIKVKGKQTHGSRPWSGVDPITTSAQIIMGLQTIISRQTELTKEAAVISIGKIKGGLRSNIIPEEVEMIGTIRTLDKEMQTIIHEKIRNTVINIAKSAGAVAEVTIEEGYPITFNDPKLTREMISSLFNVIGAENVMVTPASTGAEDFSFFAQEVPGMYYFVGGKPLDVSEFDAAPHHTPDFYIDESGMIVGIKGFAALTIDYMRKHTKK